VTATSAAFRSYFYCATIKLLLNSGKKQGYGVYGKQIFPDLDALMVKGCKRVFVESLLDGLWLRTLVWFATEYFRDVRQLTCLESAFSFSIRILGFPVSACNFYRE